MQTHRPAAGGKSHKPQCCAHGSLLGQDHTWCYLPNQNSYWNPKNLRGCAERALVSCLPPRRTQHVVGSGHVAMMRLKYYALKILVKSTILIFDRYSLCQQNVSLCFYPIPCANVYQVLQAESWGKWNLPHVFSSLKYENRYFFLLIPENRYFIFFFN